ncbi:MAG: hypothetical protein V4475_03585 [Pseudomonadota bacterium]
MRILAFCAPLLLLAGCDPAPTPSGAAPSGQAAAPADAAAGAFDYRYAYRLPGARINAVQESHAKGCDQLGPARCRITAIRYKVDDQSNVVATLTLRIDPTLARAFGKQASATVTSSGGALITADVAGADSIAAAGRGEAVMAKLRAALDNAEAQGRAKPGDATITARADRLRTAIATIGELDQGAGSALATTPMILTYASGGSIPGVGASADASFETAGATFMTSLAGLAVVLAGVGPWALLLIGGALALRWLLQGREERTQAPDLPAAPHESSESRNVVQRWFSREEQHEPEHAE